VFGGPRDVNQRLGKSLSRQMAARATGVKGARRAGRVIFLI
jgi:hypothetical protein